MKTPGRELVLIWETVWMVGHLLRWALSGSNQKPGGKAGKRCVTQAQLRERLISNLKKGRRQEA